MKYFLTFCVKEISGWLIPRHKLIKLILCTWSYYPANSGPRKRITGFQCVFDFLFTLQTFSYTFWHFNISANYRFHRTAGHPKFSKIKFLINDLKHSKFNLLTWLPGPLKLIFFPRNEKEFHCVINRFLKDGTLICGCCRYTPRWMNVHNINMSAYLTRVRYLGYQRLVTAGRHKFDIKLNGHYNKWKPCDVNESWARTSLQ